MALPNPTNPLQVFNLLYIYYLQCCCWSFSMFPNRCFPLFPSISLSLSFPICVALCLSLFLSLYNSVSLSLFSYLHILLYVCLSTCVSIYLVSQTKPFHKPINSVFVSFPSLIPVTLDLVPRSFHTEGLW